MRGTQSYIPWSKLKVFGTLVVKGLDNIQIKNNEE